MRQIIVKKQNQWSLKNRKKMLLRQKSVLSRLFELQPHNKQIKVGVTNRHESFAGSEETFSFGKSVQLSFDLSTVEQGCLHSMF